jgi:hypothetical protein
LIDQIQNVEQLCVRPLRADARIVPMRVRLEKNALAKSHRPDDLFSSNTCPIIGVGAPGELFVQASTQGLNALKRKIKEGTSPSVVKAISTVRSISPFSESDRLRGMTADEVFARACVPQGSARLKVRLFECSSTVLEETKRRNFQAILQQNHIVAHLPPKCASQQTMVVECSSPQQVRVLAGTALVRAIGSLPAFHILRDARMPARSLPDNLASPASNPSEHPIIAVIDSGIDARNPVLNSWIYARERHVAANEENTYHGTFVAGMIVWGDQLNAGVPEIERIPCRLLDIHVLPNDDPAHGPVGTLSEPEFLQSVEECLRKHANEVKVWNLSLSSKEVCALDQFSDLAIALDNLQEQYDVTFVIAAGNYEKAPFPSYPRNDRQKDEARITSPADSVLGITVGAIAHLDHPSDGVRRGEPSPFSRNGPGPNYIIKPDLVHFGGNVALDGSNLLGVSSVLAPDQVTESIGTSFSAPLVARQLAYIYHSVTPSPTSTLARALLTHNARDVRTHDRVPDLEDHFLGFGTPSNITRALECTPWMTTLVFEETLRPGYFLEWDDFPFPRSLTHDGVYRGEIWMTLAYQPHRDDNFGSEYCESHVGAHFGLYVDTPKGEDFKGQVPPEHKNPGQLYESFQVKHLRKWAPVRTYYRLIERRGIRGRRWRLKVDLLTRHDIGRSSSMSQKFALILTIADPKKDAPIYDEMAQLLHVRYKTQNLTVRSTVRVQPGVG